MGEAAEVIELQPMTSARSKPIVTIDIEQRNALAHQTNRIAIQVKALEITSDEEYELAADALKDIAHLDKEIELLYKPANKYWSDGHKESKAGENELRDPLKKFKDIVGRAMGKYQADLERQRQIEREMLLEQQRAAALASAAELAEGLAENGDTEAAVAVLEQAEKIQPEVNCESVAPHVRGTAVLTTWKYEIVNLDELPRKYLIPNDVMIAAEVKACKENTVIPGVKVFSETKVSARA